MDISIPNLCEFLVIYGTGFITQNPKGSTFHDSRIDGCLRCNLCKTFTDTVPTR